MNRAAPKPLAGLRVLDLSRILAGPWCTQLLADMGAEVIKIERPGAGDDTRTWGPPYLKDAQGNDTSEAAYYLSCNRGKQSVCIDIATTEGQALVHELAVKCDVLVENYKVGQLKKYGLDYEALKALNAKLVYCSITGFGQTGPDAQRAGYDYVIQGMAGFMSITGEKEGTANTQPQKAGVAITDLFTGLYSANAIQAALLQRERTGLGQYIDMALLDVMVASLANMNLNYLTTGHTPLRKGNQHANLLPYGVFPTSDGHLIIAVGNDAQFSKLCAVANRPELASDKRFATNPARVRNRELLIPLIEVITATRSKQNWMDALEAVGVPCGPINNIAEAFAEPQVVAREMRFDLPHALGQTMPMVRSPIVFDHAPLQSNMPPPLLGEHTDAVLRELLGKAPGEIAALRAQLVVS
jgi:formyl-CoA transferase